MHAFVTGSYAYGIPRADSDIDLVVLVSPRDLKRLTAAVEDEVKHEEAYITAGGQPLQFGKLNLICCTNKAYYEVWKRGTLELKARAPVTRDEAIEHMRALRHKAGFANCGPVDKTF